MPTKPRNLRNVLVAALGSHGDVYPLRGIAKQLKKRGHCVTLFTHAHFRSLALTHGVDCISLDSESDYLRFANHPDLFNPRQAFSIFMRSVVFPNIQKAYNALLDYVQPNQTILVASMTVFAARMIQEKHNIPLATIHTMPMQIKSAYEIPRVAGFRLPDWSPVVLNRFFWWVADMAVFDPLIGPQLNSFRRTIGLKPVKRIITKWVHSPDAVICMFPDWFASPQPDWPPSTINTGFPLFDEWDEIELNQEVQQFLVKGSPPVVFMPGSLMQQGKQFFSESKTACEMIGVRAIFLTRYASQVPGNLPPAIRHFSYVPFSCLLPHCSLSVHHGGIGTTAQALRAGIPQLIYPMAYDQYDNAARLEKVGVGTSIRQEN